MRRLALLPRNGFALLFMICFAAFLSGCISLECNGCSKCGDTGGEGCISHTPPSQAPGDPTFHCTAGSVCDPGGTCLRGMTCKTSVTLVNNELTCSCGCKN